MSTPRRLLLVFLLTLLMISFAGHVLNAASSSHHFLAESTCALHHGMDVPVNLPPVSNEAGTSLVPALDQACALNFVSSIPHPPTF